MGRTDVQQKKVLLGLFYRPPNSNFIYNNTIEDSIHLAVDTGINDIIITGDFNYNTTIPQSTQRVNTIKQQYNLHQVITDYTHFTETSSSTIDILFLSNMNTLFTSGVTDPFLNQEHRYHCPIYALFKFNKPNIKPFSRQIWLYDQGNYDMLRQKVLATDWTICVNDNISTYAEQFTDTLLCIMKQCITNKTITVRPKEPPWLTKEVKNKIKNRKRAYHKAKRTQSPRHWAKFKKT